MTNDEWNVKKKRNVEQWFDRGIEHATERHAIPFATEYVGIFFIVRERSLSDSGKPNVALASVRRTKWTTSLLSNLIIYRCAGCWLARGECVPPFEWKYRNVWQQLTTNQCMKLCQSPNKIY